MHLKYNYVLLLRIFAAMDDTTTKKIRLRIYCRALNISPQEHSVKES